MSKKKLGYSDYEQMVREIARLVDEGETHFDAQKAIEEGNRLTFDQIENLEQMYFRQVCSAT